MSCVRSITRQGISRSDRYTLLTPERFAVGPHTARPATDLRVHPNVVVQNRSPADYQAGRDAQLERALGLLLDG
jgi:hypothetical protein